MRAAAAAAGVLLLPGSAGPVLAQGSLEVSPLRVELAASPGGTITQAVSLTNTGTEPVRVRARLSDWDLARDGAPQFESAPEGGPYSATAWVRIAPPEQVLPPKKEGTVRFSVATPSSAQAGDTGPASSSSSCPPRSIRRREAARCSSGAGSRRSFTSTSASRPFPSS
jgi:P pilus assembly chaperone PapD